MLLNKSETAKKKASTEAAEKWTITGTAVSSNDSDVPLPLPNRRKTGSKIINSDADSTHDVDEEIPSHLEDPRLDEERSELTDQDDIEIIEEPVETAERE